MSRSSPEPPVDRTQAQADPPAQHTAELGGDSTNPTFGTLSANPAAGFPFLSAPQAADELGRLGEYRVLKLLGEGGMGFVFRGEDTALKRPVALKVMRPEVATKPNAAERFLREGRAAAGLKSDHVITIYQVGRANGVPFLAMEFLEGLPVDAWLRKQTKPVTLALAVRIARDCLRGLAAAHEKGLVHRDIKPANLWIEKGTGRVKVLDFGLTRGADGGDQMTVEGAVVGTPAFMAPEQAHGKPVDGRADLFSVGTVMHTLLTGKNPFQRDTLMGTLGAVGFDDPPPVTEARPDVPAAHAAFIARLLSKKPEDRPADAKAALRELADADKQSAQTQATETSAAAIPIPATAPTAVWSQVVDASADAPTRLAEPAAGGPRKPPVNKLLLAGGLFGFLALALAGVVIVIKNKDGTETRIEVPDGAAVEVRKDGKTVAAVGPKKTDVAKPAADPDRAAAEWVLSVGGWVQVEDFDAVRAAADLPARPFRLWGAHLVSRPRVTDAGLACLAGCTELRHLAVHDVPVTDAGLAAFRRSKKLTHLWVSKLRITDAGLEHFAGCTDLEALYMYESPITGTGLVHFKDCHRLTLFSANQSRMTDAGLEHLKDLKGLTEVHLGGTRVTTAGLAHLAGCTELQKLNLGHVATDAGLAHFRQSRKLTHLWLLGARVTDAGLAGFHGCDQLEVLDVRQTRVTAKGLAAFRAARPGVAVMSDFDTDPDRRAAELVVARKGRVKVVGGTADITDAATLPAGPFKIADVRIDGVTDADLEVFRELTAVGNLHLTGPYTDAGMATLAAGPCAAAVTELTLQSPTITDDVFASVAKFPKLDRLMLDGDSPIITGKGLGHLSGSSVSHLSLTGNKMADAEYAHLKNLPKLSVLRLPGSPVGAAGLVHVGEVRQLQQLSLYYCGNLNGTGLKPLEHLTELNWLEVAGLTLSPDGCAVLAALPKLKFFYAVNAKVTDEGAAALARSPSMNTAMMSASTLTDAGLKSLAGCKTLKIVDVRSTKVSVAGAAAFRKARPDVQLTCDDSSK